MKTKIILPAIIVLLIAVFVANGIYGAKVAKEIDANLKTMIAENELPVEITYTKVKVNPLFSKVKIVEVSVAVPDKSRSFKCNSVHISVPPSEVLRLTEMEEFEEIKSFELTLVKPQVNTNEAGPSVEFSKLVVDFDGDLSKADFEKLAMQFPDKKQKIELSFSDLKVKFPENSVPTPLISKLQEQFSTIDAGTYTLIYNPDSKEINSPEFSIKSPVISYSGQTLFKYDGNNATEFKPKTLEMKTEMNLEPKSFKWEDENGGKGEFQLDKLVFNTNTQISFDNRTLPKGDMNIELKKLKINYDDENANKASSMMNLSVKDLDIRSLEFNCQMDEERLSITDSRIESSLLEADIYADADIDNSNPANSTINEAKVTIQKLGPDLEKLVNGLEMQMGKELPRENGAIVLELTGKLSRPTIKGFEF